MRPTGAQSTSRQPTKSAPHHARYNDGDGAPANHEATETPRTAGATGIRRNGFGNPTEETLTPRSR